MFNSVKLKAGVMCVGVLILPNLASAQVYDGQSFLQNNDLNVQASVTFKIPLGSTDRRRILDQPRLGFGLGLARNDFDSPLGRLSGERLTLLDVGAYGLKTPSVQLSGQEVYGPIFVALNAGEADDKSETKKKDKGLNAGLILLAGAAVVVAVGTTILVDEVEDALED